MSLRRSILPTQLKALLLMTLLGCGSSGESAAARAAGIALSDDVGRYVNAVCARNMRCEPPFFSSHEACLRSYVAALDCNPVLAHAQLSGVDKCVAALAHDSICGRVF